MRTAKFTRYKPKRWHPEFDLIILASFTGEKNEEIGKRFGYTKEHISNILCSEEAEKVRQKLRSNIDKELELSVNTRMKAISDTALKRVEDFISNDDLARSSPFMFVDRAFRAAQLSGISNEGKNGSKVEVNVLNQTQNNVGNEVIDRMALALERSNEVSLLHSGLDPTKQINVRANIPRSEEDRQS